MKRSVFPIGFYCPSPSFRFYEDVRLALMEPGYLSMMWG